MYNFEVARAFTQKFGNNQTNVQCLFKLTGQNALNLKFKTRFSQIGLSLGENL